MTSAMPLSVLILWIANVLLATAGQLAFKAAAGDQRAGNGLARWSYMLRRPWLWTGVVCYVLEFVLWVAFLSLVPLSRGVLLGSFNIVVVVLAGRALWRERLTRWRIAGIGLVTAGVAIVGSGL